MPGLVVPVVWCGGEAMVGIGARLWRWWSRRWNRHTLVVVYKDGKREAFVNLRDLRRVGEFLCVRYDRHVAYLPREAVSLVYEYVRPKRKYAKRIVEGV